MTWAWVTWTCFMANSPHGDSLWHRGLVADRFPITADELRGAPSRATQLGVSTIPHFTHDSPVAEAPSSPAHR